LALASALITLKKMINRQLILLVVVQFGGELLKKAYYQTRKILILQVQIPINPSLFGDKILIGL
jgi:hypothetical protein